MFIQNSKTISSNCLPHYSAILGGSSIPLQASCCFTCLYQPNLVNHGNNKPFFIQHGLGKIQSNLVLFFSAISYNHPYFSSLTFFCFLGLLSSLGLLFLVNVASMAPCTSGCESFYCSHLAPKLYDPALSVVNVASHETK